MAMKFRIYRLKEGQQIQDYKIIKIFEDKVKLMYKSYQFGKILIFLNL